MRDYLNQLAIRTQQPEQLVKPRPISRFESSPFSTFKTFESSESLEPFGSITTKESRDEPELPSDQLISSRISADESRQHIESRNRNESETIDSNSRSWSTAESPKPFPRQSGTEPFTATHAAKKETSHRSWHEVEQTILGTQPIAQSEQVAREPIKPAVQIEKPEEINTISFYKPSPEQGEFPRSIEHGNKPRAEIKKTADVASAVSSHLPALRQSTEIKQHHVHTEKEQIRPFIPLVSTEEPQQKVAFSNSGHTIERRSDLMPASNFFTTPRREIFSPSAEPTVFQHATERQTEASTPTIQVTIGRIEVRATVAAATPARKTSAKSSAMSLDEYLKQRQRGVRT